MTRTRNEALAARIAETGWSQPKVAAAVVRVAQESGAEELYATSRSHIAMWIQGTRPSGQAPHILCETLTRKLGRPLTLVDIGLEPVSADRAGADSEWSVDTVTALAKLGRDDLDMDRRQALATTAYSMASLTLPRQPWWDRAPETTKTRSVASPRTITEADVDDVRQTTRFFSARDQQRGGAAGRSALAAHLRFEAAPLLSSRFSTDQLRREAHSAIAEMTYLAGWMAFDASEHRIAQRYLTLAVQLAAEADDGPLAGHILRAMAHQAVDLGHPSKALDLADASMEAHRYGQASWREKALIGIVHARALASSGDRAGTLAAITRAERDLERADDTDAPDRVTFFGQASLAHETACALRDLGNPRDAEAHFKRSVATRRRQLYARTHSVTLGYLGAVQVRQGRLDEACGTWSQALDAMTGVHSGRARDVIVRMQRDLSPVRRRGGRRVAELDQRAREVLRTIG
ncbi:Tat pathway signal protein [Streptomyces sp. NPDC002004]